MPYTVHQQLNDPGTPWGRQVFLKSANLKELSDPVIEIITRLRRQDDLADDDGADQPVGRGDQPRRRRRDGVRAPRHEVHRSTSSRCGPTRPMSERHIDWARAFHDALRPHMNGIYVNEMGPDERIHDAYSAATLARLVEVKNDVRPDQLLPDEPERPTGDLRSRPESSLRRDERDPGTWAPDERGRPCRRSPCGTSTEASGPVPPRRVEARSVSRAGGCVRRGLRRRR